MTPNEKLVWAAAFALAHSKESTWALAALKANGAVLHLRRATESATSPYCDAERNADSLAMLEEMRRNA